MNFDSARHNMVTQQVRSWDVIDKRVLNAMLQIQREEFVQVAQRKLAFADISLPIGHNQNMMKPVVEGRMLQALDLSPTHQVLEVGTGSAYVTALLSQLSSHVTSIDHIDSMTRSAQAKLAEQGLNQIDLIHADFFQFEPQSDYDRIVITGALAQLPDTVFDWLKPGGKVFAIIGKAPIMEARTYTEKDHYISHFDTCVDPLEQHNQLTPFAL